MPPSLLCSLSLWVCTKIKVTSLHSASVTLHCSPCQALMTGHLSLDRGLVQSRTGPRCAAAVAQRPHPHAQQQALLASFGLYPCHTSGRSAVGGLRSVRSAPATHGHHTLPCARCISPTDTLCWDTGQMLHFQPLSPSVSPHAEFSLFAFQSRL